MIAPFARSTTFIVGKAQISFYLHTDLVERTCHKLKLHHGQIDDHGVVRLPLSDQGVFRLFSGFLHGIFPNLTWSNAEDRSTLVDLAIIAHWLGTYSLQYWLTQIIVDEGRLFDVTKYCPGFEALKKAYDDETTDRTFFLRKVVVDCYVHMGRDNHFTELIDEDIHKILADQFWHDFSYRAGWWRRVEARAEWRDEDPPPRFLIERYFPRTNPVLLRAPRKMTRQGVEISNSVYFRFNRICIADGKDPLLIHQSLTDSRADIANGVPPHDISFPSGWRNAVLIYMEWLYHGRVIQEADHLKDLILAYCLALPWTTHFKNAIISAIVSWCARYAIVPSDADIVLAYLWTSSGSPLRKFLAAWAFTHPTEDLVDLTKMPKDIRETWLADLAHEQRVRQTSVDLDIHRMAVRGGAWESDPINGACFWNGEDLMDDNGLVVGPYYFDNVCKRFHIHDKFDDTRIPGWGGRAGRECRDFHGPSDHLPYIIMYLPDSLEKCYREGWFDKLDNHIPSIEEFNHWARTCISDRGWPAFHRRMLLGNSDWLCRRCRDGTAYFVRIGKRGRLEKTHTDPRKVEWVRGEDPWGGNFPVVPSDGIPEYSWEEHFEGVGFTEEWEHLSPDAKSEDDGGDIRLAKLGERKGGFATDDPKDNLDSFSLSEGSFPGDDEHREESVDERAAPGGGRQDGSGGKSENESNIDVDYPEHERDDGCELSHID